VTVPIIGQMESPRGRNRKAVLNGGSGSSGLEFRRPGAGRPQSSRQRISETLLRDLAEVWENNGKIVLEKIAVTDPAKLATIAYGLLPRDVFVKVQADTPMLGHDRIIELLDILEGAGVESADDLRARLAKPVEK
jgi:hypothetical protein